MGTGPLVDPGFVGQIYLPLHNLTCNEYRLVGGEPVAWMEFTKISPNESWCDHDRHGRLAPYVPFPQRKQNRKTVEDYLGRSSPTPVMSSISSSVEKAQRSAHASERAVASTRTRITVASIVALGALLVALVAIYLQVQSVVDDSNSSQSKLTQQVGQLEREVAVFKAQRK